MYCAKLDFGFNIKTPGFPLEEHESVRHYTYDYNNLDIRLIKYLEEKNIYITFAEIFYSPPNTRIPIHLDAPNLKHFTKLNICISDESSYMNWYSVKPEFINKIAKLTILHRPYLEYKLNEVDLVYTKCINGIYLVNASIPHDSTNFTNLSRWTLSLGLNDSKIKDELEFEEAYNRLESIII